MASDSLNVTVYVKSLTGDLIELSVNPEKGLDGVANALTLFDSETYRPFQFRCFFLDEEVTELTQDAMLGVVFVEEPMARLEEIQKDVVVPEVNGSYSRTYNKVFKFSLSSHFYTVLYVYTYEKNGVTYSCASFQPLTIAKMGTTSSLSVVYHELTNIQLFNISDAYVIVEVLKKFFPNAPTYETWLTREDSVYCECGCIVKQASMSTHLKTKKHTNNDAKGKTFMARVAAYVESLQME